MRPFGLLFQLESLVRLLIAGRRELVGGVNLPVRIDRDLREFPSDEDACQSGA